MIHGTKEQTELETMREEGKGKQQHQLLALIQTAVFHSTLHDYHTVIRDN